MPAFVRLRLALVLSGLALVASPTLYGQAYSVQRIEQPAGASSLIGTGLNNQGHVVGWSQFFGAPPTLRSWIWTPETGLTYLTPPPGQSLLRAMDVNDSDVIAGDGGYDTGVAWRYTNGVFELLGVLPGGDTVSTAGGINASGDIAGASRFGSSFLVPPSAFVSKPGQTLQEVYSTGTGTAINSAGQVVGYSTINQAFRYTPGSGAQLLGPLGNYNLNFPWGINSAGDVVGEAVKSNSSFYEPLPFLYTNAGGMQKIGTFTGHAAAVSINDARQVVGNYFAPGLPFTYSWIWSAQTGVHYLKDMVAPAEHINILKAARINASGQILCQAVDNQSGDHVVAILTPVGAAAWTHLGFGLDGSFGQPLLNGQGALTPGATVSLTLSNALASAPMVLVVGLDAIHLPLKGGVLVPSFAPPQGLLLPLVTNASGGLQLASTWTAAIPSGSVLYAQAWLPDPAGSAGFAASNAVSVTSP
jgi:probable HAF family extracellular repeat protein